jgi:hypothetical protein
MSALKTRLDGFLRVVEIDEDAAGVAHAGSVRELNAARGRCEELRLELRKDGPKRGTSQEWMMVELERQRLVETLKFQEQQQARCEKAEQMKRQALAVAHQKAESIRHAIDRLRGEQIRAINKREQVEQDDLAIQRHRRTG